MQIAFHANSNQRKARASPRPNRLEVNIITRDKGHYILPQGSTQLSPAHNTYLQTFLPKNFGQVLTVLMLTLPQGRKSCQTETNKQPSSRSSKKWIVCAPQTSRFLFPTWHLQVLLSPQFPCACEGQFQQPLSFPCPHPCRSSPIPSSSPNPCALEPWLSSFYLQRLFFLSLPHHPILLLWKLCLGRG